MSICTTLALGLAPAVGTTTPLGELDLTTLSGKALTPTTVNGKVTLVVNVASRCGYTRQYEGLQKLYSAYQGKGLVILGAPCNQFGGQEPGTADEIAQFCKRNFGVTFPILSKQDVNGKNARSSTSTSFQVQRDKTKTSDGTLKNSSLVGMVRFLRAFLRRHARMHPS